MIFRKLPFLLLLLFTIFACSDDDENDDPKSNSSNNNTNNTTNEGTYKIEFTGDTNFTVEGEAEFSQYARDTLVQITLDEDGSAPSEGIITLRSSNGVFMQQTLPADAFTSGLLTTAAIIHEDPNELEFGSYSGTLEITDAEKANFINATFQGMARDLDTKNDTLQFSGTMNAKVQD